MSERCVITVEADEEKSPQDGTWAIITSIIVVILLFVVLIGVVIRKRAHGTTWFPEGFCVFGRSSIFGDQRFDIEQVAFLLYAVVFC